MRKAELDLFARGMTEKHTWKIQQARPKNLGDTLKLTGPHARVKLLPRAGIERIYQSQRGRILSDKSYSEGL